jgi:hypothetical protein
MVEMRASTNSRFLYPTRHKPVETFHTCKVVGSFTPCPGLRDSLRKRTPFPIDVRVNVLSGSSDLYVVVKGRMVAMTGYSTIYLQ